MLSASEDWPLPPAQPDYDLLTDIRAKVRGLPIKVHWKRIKGHQDDGPSHDSLDEWAQANIYMDSLAKAHWNYLNETGHCPSPQRFKDENWSISFQDKKTQPCGQKATLLCHYGTYFQSLLAEARQHVCEQYLFY
jgi:hypothetical protein